MKTGDIIFVRPKNWIGRAITFFDKGEFCHVAIALDERRIFEAERGVNVRIIDNPYIDFEVVDLGLTYEQQQQIIEYAPSYLGKQYDYIQVFLILIRKVFHLDKKYMFNSLNTLICSELIDLILFQIGEIPYDGSLGQYTPNELYRYLTEFVNKKKSLEEGH